MERSIEPFGLGIDMDTGELLECDKKVLRYLSETKDIYADYREAEKILECGDVLTYEVHIVDIPESDGHLGFCLSITHAGRVGREYFMTKGHYHSKEGTAEIYICLRGRGYMLMETRDGRTAEVPMSRGRVVYVPPYWAHRTVNTGDDDLVSLCIFPADAGHDYASIEKSGFRKRVVEGEEGPLIVDAAKPEV
ncbi:MAG: glucose-6-phosphate isomerase family protein [bacterium]